jgi:glycosyltransferase involved in cell wall biosynthesis
MKLAILGSRGIPARYGGFETFAEQLAVRLVERGHEVTVFCEASDQAPEQLNAEYKGVKLRRVPTRALGPLSTLAYDAACFWQARSSFDVVYMLGYGSSALCWLPRIWGTRVWINMDGLEWARGKWGPVARQYLRWAETIAMWTPDRIIADAAAIRANLQSRYRKLPPCDVIPYGGDIATSAHPENLGGFGLDPGSYYLVVCRFEPENHVREIIEGFLHSGTQARLVLVGDHTRKSAYVESLRRFQGDRLLFIGPVYDRSKIQALRFFCRAYFHGHSVGGTNPSLLEAMGCGNAIVAHDNPFNREVLGGAGLFFSASDSVSTCIDSVDCGGADVASMKAAVVERVKQFYTWDRITDYYCQLLLWGDSKSRKRDETIDCAPLYSTNSVPFDRNK